MPDEAPRELPPLATLTWLAQCPDDVKSWLAKTPASDLALWAKNIPPNTLAMQLVTFDAPFDVKAWVANLPADLWQWLAKAPTQ